MRQQPFNRAANNHPRYVAGLAIAALFATLTTVLVPTHPDPRAAFQTIEPGMSDTEVRAVLVRPHVADTLARSFGSPVKEAQAVLRGDPSFEKREWGRVDSPSVYEAEWAREWKADNRVPLSTADRRMYTVRQWGVANTQSYSFIGIFDEDDVLVCRYWNVPSESRFRGWLRRTFRR
jgi:hypothetical protein